MKRLIILILMVFGLLGMNYQVSSAVPLAGGVWDGWTQFAADDGFSSTGFVNPGWGGQYFDAEYLYYKFDGTKLSIGLQTGFDLYDGIQGVSDYGGTGYYGGDLALSFDGDGSGFEYGVDFGFSPQFGYYAGTEQNSFAAGLYNVSAWNDDSDIYFAASNPFAIKAATLVQSLNSQTFSEQGGTVASDGQTSFFQKVSFDISSIVNVSDSFTLDAHWTMSCGNDAVDGSVNIAPVPEPSTILLMCAGLLGMVGVRRLKR